MYDAFSLFFLIKAHGDFLCALFPLEENVRENRSTRFRFLLQISGPVSNVMKRN